MTHPPTRALAIAAALLAFAGAGFDAVESDAGRDYAVSTLPSLGGTNSRGNGVSASGLVSGFSNHAGDEARTATVWFRGRLFDLGAIGGTNSSAAWSSLANNGLVVGITQTAALQTRSDGWSCRAFFPGPDAAKYVCVGFVWDRGRMRELPTLGGDNGFAASANVRRQVVGWTEGPNADGTCLDPADREFKAILWDLNRGRMRELPPYGIDTASAATAISDRGHVVGISGDCDQSVGRRTARHAVLWAHDTVRDLGTLGSDSWNTPTAITPRGDIVVGFANAPGASAESPRFRAWLWTERTDVPCVREPGTNLCDLGTLDEGGTAEAWGVNQRGQVVGTSCPPEGPCKAFLWARGVMIDLNQVKGGYSWHLENAMDINESGRIVGRARTPEGFVAFTAVPSRRP